MNPLAQVRAAAKKADAARAGLYLAIEFARADGSTLREIAEASGLNHETVRQIIRKGQPAS